MRPRGKDIVIVLALLAAGGWGAWILLHSRGAFGRGWTDGERVYRSIGDEIRYALWRDPEPLGGGINSQEAEGRSAISPDGRYLVFAVGERGLDADLYVADLIDGQPVDPRPLAAVNTGSDEVAPAFGPKGLYFASDRAGAAFGLDLWVASYEGGELGEPEPLTPGVNTPADETDPLPLPLTGEIVFASNRARGGRTDFDLYLASPGEQDRLEAVALAALNSPFDEREPSCTADGRALIYASNRRGAFGGDGGFDLYRSVEKGGTWLPPRALEGVNTDADERAPLLSPDGFSLIYTRARGAPADLFRARSLELFLLPPRPVTLLDSLILLALLLLALLAWLARRWPTMEVIYRCFLVSLLVHMLLLYLLRRMYPEGTPFSFAGENRPLRVRLESSSPRTGGSNRERRGQVRPLSSATQPTSQPGRIQAQLELARAAPGPVSFEIERPAESLPGRRAARHRPQRPRAEPTVRLDDSGAPFEPMADAAPAMAVPPGARAEAPARPDAGAPERAVAEDVVTAPVALAFQPVARGRRRREAVPGPLAIEAVRALPALDGGASVAVAEPREAIVRSSGEAPGMTLPTAVFHAAPVREANGPERAPSLEAHSVSTMDRAEGLPRDAGPFARPEPPTLVADTPAERAVERQRSPARLRSPDIPLPDEPLGRERVVSRRFDPVATLGGPSVSRDRGPELEPTRRHFAREEDEVRPKRRGLALPPPPTRPSDDVPRRVAHTPYRNRFGGEKARALELYGGGEQTEQAVASGLEYLASIQGEDGHWGSPADRHDKYHHVLIGKTGLSLLAFLGAGHTQGSATAFSGVVRGAVDFLLWAQDEESGHFGDSSSYSHGIATYALAECYALTGDEGLVRPLERAVAHILENQSRRRDPRTFGGWGYYFPDGHVWNDDRWPRVSVTAWQVMALESARIGGLDVPAEVFRDARTFVENAVDEDRGAIRYCHDPSRLRSGYPILPASTPAGLFALSLLGKDLNDRDLVAQVRFVLERSPRSYRYTSDDDFVFRARGNLYFWYYATLAMFRRGGSAWERWNAAMKGALLDGQDRDGSWEPISVYARYAGDDRRDKSYSTAMCVLTLEIYYRYFTPLLEAR